MRALGRFIWRFMVIFSFLVNVILIVVLIVVGILIFEIKNNIADPLIGGLHSTAVGLESATIDWTIPVRSPLDIALQVPINSNTIISQVTEIGGQPVDFVIPGETVVTLTRPVPITIPNAFIQSADLTLRNASVSITLPAGTRLPVALDMEVGLQTQIPVELDVRAVIPLAETQLADPIQQLGLLFEPLAVALHNLPSDFNEAGMLVGMILSGRAGELDLLAREGGTFNEQPYNAWPGFSQTAGLDYGLLGEPLPNPNVATGIVPPGGIPVLDAEVRPQIYNEYDSPSARNEAAQQALQAQGLPPYTWNGSMAEYYRSLLTNPSALPPTGPVSPSDNANAVPEEPRNDFGIVPSNSNP